MSTLRYRRLSQEQIKAIGIPENSTEIGVAVNEDDVVVGVCSFLLTKRGALCDSCTGHCAVGGYVYVAPEYRGNNLFKDLFDWLRVEAGIDKNYISRTDPKHLLIASLYGLAIPKPGTVSDQDDDLVTEMAAAEALVARMSSELVFE